MRKEDPVYITGHRHPDTDSIASSIAYAFFKRSMGMQAIPCRLGSLNEETRYLLSLFGFPEPMLLQDTRMKLSEIAMDAPIAITPDTTIYETLQIMQKDNRAYCGIVDENQRLVGLVTKSDIAVVGLGDTAMSIEILAHTATENNFTTSQPVAFRNEIVGSTATLSMREAFVRHGRLSDKRCKSVRR